MKDFLIYSLIFCSLIFGSIYSIICQVDGYTDPFYLRFTTPKQHSMILGTSREAQGLQPKEFKKILSEDIFNYAFTILHSPFGPTYLESVKKKIDPNTKNGTFIIGISPWSIASNCKSPNDSLAFREANLFLATTPNVTSNPNITYLQNNITDRYYKVLFSSQSLMFLHNDGWLEITIPMDSMIVEKRTDDKIDFYKKKHLPKFKFSKLRLKYLMESIHFLNQYGKVYLVRLPVHPCMMEIEKELMPDFDSKLQNAIEQSAGYLDLTKWNADYSYIDGNHLYKDSGNLVSQTIATWILNQND